MLQLKNIYKTYSSKNGVTHRALENVTLKFSEKGLVFILGKSGSGKSTLLNLIGGIDNYDRGDIIFYDKNFSSFKEADYDYYRNTCVGFVFQDFNLLNNLTVFENVSLALDLQAKKDDNKILDLLDKMGVIHLKNRMVNELSGGQKQRVAIARALIKNPKIILADEPTGALDSETSDEIIKILEDLSKDRLVIVVTHNKELAYEHGDRIIEIRDGFVLKDLLRKNQDLVIDNETSTLVSSNLVIVPKGAKISQENVDDLNVTISEKRQNYYLLIESNKNRAMSLYPNVSEVIDDNNNDDTFVPYHHKKVNKQDIKKVRSNYPIKKSIKFAFAGMKRKKLKLFLSILLSIFSVILTGSAVNFTNYSLSTAVGESISKDNGNQLEVSSSFAINDESYKLQNVDLAYLQSLGKEVGYIYEQALKYQYDVSFTSNDVDDNLAKDNLFINKTFLGFLVCDDIEDFGFESNNFKVIYELDNITEEDYNTGVYISSIVAETIVRYNIYDNKKLHDYTHISKLVGEKINVSSSFYTILGIYDIDENESMYNKFKTLHEEINNGYLYNEYLNAAKTSLLRLVVKPQFIETFKQNCRYLKVKSLTKDMNNIHDVTAEFVKSMESISFSKENTEIHFYNNEWNESNYEEKLKNMKPNQILISTSFFKTITGKYYSESNKDEMRDLLNSYNKRKYTLTIENNRTSSVGREIYQAMEGVEVVGVVVKNPGDSSTVRRIYVSGATYKGLLDNYYRANRALIKMDPSDDYAKIVQTLYDNGFTINNEFVSYFLDFASAIEKYSTLINIGVVIWFVIVGMLLYSFMASSIKDSSREIGILKALGANMKDIYKIFIVEAVFIGIFALLFGIIGYYFVGLLVNNIVTYLFYTFYFTIFTFDFVTVLVMIISIILILVISLIIPMSKISNIKPIDVMNYNK